MITFGLPHGKARALFQIAFNHLAAGGTLEVRRRSRLFLKTMDVILLPVAQQHYDEHLGVSIWFYQQGDFPGLQHASNSFPWEKGVDEGFCELQDDLIGGAAFAP